jgi:hypothetical protein
VLCLLPAVDGAPPWLLPGCGVVELPIIFSLIVE